MSGRSIGMMERMGMKPKKTVPKKTPRVPETERARVARTAHDVRPPRPRSPEECVEVEALRVTRPSSSRSSSKRPSSDRPREEEEERQLVRSQKKSREVPPARSTAGPIVEEAPLAIMPLNERAPPTSSDPSRGPRPTAPVIPRGEPYFGRDEVKAERVLTLNPGRPPMVVDFLAGRNPRDSVETPLCVTRAISNLPRAWTTELNEASNCGGDDATQALFALTLQAATMAATVARESELRPPVKKLKAELAELKQRHGELVEQTVKMEKDFVDAAEVAKSQIDHLKEANASLKEQVEEAVRAHTEALKQAATEMTLFRDETARAAMEMKRLSERAEAAEAQGARAAKLAEELTAKSLALDREREESVARETELERLRAALASREAQEAEEEEEESDDPSSDPSHAAEFAYYMAFADALRAAKKGGLDVGPLLESFKTYATDRPLHSGFLIPILDLSTEHGIDLSWYSRVDRLIQPSVPGEGSGEGDEEGEDRVPALEAPVPEAEKGEEAEGGERVPPTGEPAQP